MSSLSKRHLSYSDLSRTAYRYSRNTTVQGYSKKLNTLFKEVLALLGILLVAVFGSAIDSPDPWGYIAALLVLVGFCLGAWGLRGIGASGQWGNGAVGHRDNGATGLRYW